MSRCSVHYDFLKKDASAESEHTRRMKLVVRLLEAESGGKLLDVGCQYGTLREMLQTRYPRVAYFGLDLVGDETRNIIGCDLNEKSIPFGDEEFDYVVCTDVLEHVFYPAEICQEIRRVAKEGATGVISLPNEYGPAAIFYHFSRALPFDEQVHGHHWVFGIANGREFVSRFFEIEEELPYIGHMLANVIPTRVLRVFPQISTCLFWKVRVHRK